MIGKLTLGQKAWLWALGTIGLSIWCWLIAQAAAAGLHGDRNAWAFVVMFGLLAASALATLIQARSQMALFNAEAEIQRNEQKLAISRKGR